MRIIHTGDIHIGSAFVGLPREKAALRKAEILDGFSSLCAYAKDSGVSAVLIAGDLIDNNVSPLHEQHMEEELLQIKAPMGIYMVPGNHEYISGIEKSADFIKKTSTEKITTLLLSTATSDDSTVIINNDTNTSSTSSSARVCVK